MTNKLTPKQTKFVASYLGEANYNATKAARMSGYASPKASGTENLANPVIQAEIQSHLELLKDTGIRVRANRVQQLVDMDERLQATMLARAEDAREKQEQGCELPAGAEYGLLVETIKVGPKGNVSEYVIDKTLIAERRALMEQVSKELGEHLDRLQISGDADNPLTVVSAKSKLLQLSDDG
jgi:phage terminase small subunit